MENLIKTAKAGGIKPRMKKIVKMAVLQKQLSDQQNEPFNISLNTIAEIVLCELTPDPLPDDTSRDDMSREPLGRLVYANIKIEQLQMNKLKRIEFMKMKSQGLLRRNSFVSDTF